MREMRRVPFAILVACITSGERRDECRLCIPISRGILISEDELRGVWPRWGKAITRDYAGQEAGIIVVSVLRGAAIFMSDLVREIDLPLEMDYMAISSYGSGTTSSGVIRVLKDITTDIRGKHVIIAEDIIDSGLTLSKTIEHLRAMGPASVQVAALLRKNTSPSRPKSTPAMWASIFPMRLWWGMAWITPSATATCRIWAF